MEALPHVLLMHWVPFCDALSALGPIHCGFRIIMAPQDFIYCFFEWLQSELSVACF